MKADLHMHSTYSDGFLTTKELFERAHKNNVDLISITDHDIVKNVDENYQYAKEYGVKYVPGIELSTVMKGKPVHVLGYFTDDSYKSKEILDYFQEIKEKREQRAKKFIANLDEFFGIKITYKSVLSFSKGIIARPHIAKAINEVYPHYKHDYIFDHFIGDTSRAYVPSCELSVQEGINLLRRNNCLVVLAHPTLLKNYIKDDVLEMDFDGIEAKYFRNKDNDEEIFRELASKRQMFITGGGDFHGIPNDTKHGDIGQVYIDGNDFDNFIKRLSTKSIN